MEPTTRPSLVLISGKYLPKNDGADPQAIYMASPTLIQHCQSVFRIEDLTGFDLGIECGVGLDAFYKAIPEAQMAKLSTAFRVIHTESYDQLKSLMQGRMYSTHAPNIL